MTRKKREPFGGGVQSCPQGCVVPNCLACFVALQVWVCSVIFSLLSRVSFELDCLIDPIRHRSAAPLGFGHRRVVLNFEDLLVDVLFPPCHLLGLHEPKQRQV